jgi:hypothetical protein
MSINVYDNFFSEEDYNFIWNYCINAPYFYGEGDPKELFIPQDCTGLVHDVYYHTKSIKTVDQKKFFDLFSTSIEKKISEIYLKRYDQTLYQLFCSIRKISFSY